MIAVKLGLFSGVVSAIGDVLLSIDFLRAAIIAAITGILTAIGAIVGSYIAAKNTTKSVDPVAHDVEHIKRKVGAHNRMEDSHE